jgi:hypothetical protein
MTIKIKASKMTFRSRDEGITVRPNEILILRRDEVFRCGLIDVLIQIDSGSFGELARAMIEANSAEAIKAFGPHMQNISSPASSSDSPKTP